MCRQIRFVRQVWNMQFHGTFMKKKKTELSYPHTCTITQTLLPSLYHCPFVVILTCHYSLRLSARIYSFNCRIHNSNKQQQQKHTFDNCNYLKNIFQLLLKTQFKTVIKKRGNNTVRSDFYVHLVVGFWPQY